MQLLPVGARSLLVVISALILGPLAVHASNPAELQSAIDSYSQGQYSKALAKIEQLPASLSKTPVARYYKALSWQALNQVRQAEAEFMSLYQSCQDPAIRYKSWKAIAALQKYQGHRSYKGQGNNFDPSRKRTASLNAGRVKVPAKQNDDWVMAQPGYGGTGTDIGMPAGWGYNFTPGCRR